MTETAATGERTCVQCGEPFTGKGYGHGRYCSDSHRRVAAVRRRREADREGERERWRIYRADPKVAARISEQRATRMADPEVRERARGRITAYRATPEGGERQRESNRAYATRKRQEAAAAGVPAVDPVKAVARKAVSHALVAGRLTREPCLFCGAEIVEGHHHDYSKPLDVTWLCSRHHGVVHRALHTAARREGVKL